MAKHPKPNGRPTTVYWSPVFTGSRRRTHVPAVLPEDYTWDKVNTQGLWEAGFVVSGAYRRIQLAHLSSSRGWQGTKAHLSRVSRVV